MNQENYYLEKLRKSIKGGVAIFIDAANLEKSVEDMWVHPKDVPEKFKGFQPENLSWRIHYKNLKGFFKDISDLKLLNFYTPEFITDNHQKFLSLLEKMGYRVVRKPLKVYADHSEEHPHRKANFDVEISIDALANIRLYETVILFSGDSDFVYLLEFLRKNNKRVILFSRKGHVAKELFSAIDNYFDIVDFRHYFLRIVSKKPKIPLKRDSAVDNGLSTATII